VICLGNRHSWQHAGRSDFGQRWHSVSGTPRMCVGSTMHVWPGGGRWVMLVHCMPTCLALCNCCKFLTNVGHEVAYGWSGVGVATNWFVDNGWLIWAVNQITPSPGAAGGQCGSRSEDLQSLRSFAKRPVVSTCKPLCTLYIACRRASSACCCRFQVASTCAPYRKSCGQLTAISIRTTCRRDEEHSTHAE
jgi:hypothetical protein